MWFLYKLNESNENTDEKILIRPGRKYSIGRKGTSVVFQDKSVSRSHAEINVGKQTSRNAFEANFRPEVKLTDNNSKYGTFLNAQPVTTELNLNENDVIKFGSLNSALRLVWEPVVICMPSMASRDKSAVAKLATQLGVILAKEWDSKCTHLYMKKIEIKAKFFLCLISARHVISLEWLETAVAQDDVSFQLPIESDYLPQIPNDVSLRKEDCEPNSARSTLFTGLDFWIFDKEQFDRYAPIIQAAKGTAKPCDLKVVYSARDLCANNRLIVVPPEENSQFFNEIDQKLKNKNKRPIKGIEISDAIIACPAFETWMGGTAEEPEDDFAVVPDEPSPAQPSPNLVAHTPSDMSDIFDDMLGDPDPIIETSSAAPDPTSMQVDEVNDPPNPVPNSPPHTSVVEDIPEPEPATPRQRGSRRRLPLRSQNPTVTMGDGPAEEENVDVPIIPGKKYTAILCTDILCPTPPARRPATEGTGGVNFKKFKKVDSTNPRDIVDFIPTALTEADNHALREYYDDQDEIEHSVASSEHPTPGEDDPFADIRIQMTNVRRRGARTRR
ncbi:hypothetical protein BJV82DRAFT_652997 [Fennellomyces sp. T-0311]|nr:hypothetical protein BJV82DRAFT_652997 [Fennellomyces sp. T-0311]